MDVENTIQFILEQQAGFMTRLQQMADVQSGQQGIIDQTLPLIGQLAEAQQRTDEHVRELTEAQLHTDERLNALIKVVDELIRRDGRQQ